MRTVQLTLVRPRTNRLEGTFLDVEHYDRVIQEDTSVFTPNGSLLLVYLRDALPPVVCAEAFAAFRNVHVATDNRGIASGSHLKRSVPSGVFGYLDRNGGHVPYCRMTSLTQRSWPQFIRGGPFFQAASEVFRQFAPSQWRAQQAFVAIVPPEYVIPGTVFTTVTVNRNWRSAAHRDKGDYRPGFGVLAVLEGGHFTGGELVFPKYGTAVNLRTGGVLLADVHQLHGNAPLIVQPPAQRLTFVMYARARMYQCLPLADELLRVQRRCVK